MRRPSTTHNSLRAARLALGLCLLPSCLVANVDLDAQDKGVLFYGGRMSWTPKPSERTEDGERLGVTTSFDLDVTYGDASSHPSLATGHALVIGGELFSGPQVLDVDFDLTRVLLDFRISSPSSHHVFLESFIGTEYSAMSVEVREQGPGPTRSGGVSVNGIGPAVGLALVYEPIEELRLSAEVRFGFGLTSEVDEYDQTSLDVGVSAFPHEHFGLFLGWRSVRFQATAEHWLDSGLDLELSGPVIELRLRL